LGIRKPLFWITVLAATLGAVKSTAVPQQSGGTAVDSSQSGQSQPGIRKDKDNKEGRENPKNDRIFLVGPNYGTVEYPTAIYVPLTAKQKFKLRSENVFDRFSVPLAVTLAGISQAKNDDPAWGQGWGAFGKRLAAGYGDAVIGAFMSTGIFPSVTHEDPRYFRRGTGSTRSRALYALKRVVVVRTDSGRDTFNFSEFGGNAAAAAISLTYHSAQDRNFSNFATDYRTQILIDAFTNQAKEFWPDIKRKIFKK
jgi:hypothetical protein